MMRDTRIALVISLAAVSLVAAGVLLAINRNRKEPDEQANDVERILNRSMALVDEIQKQLTSRDGDMQPAT